jgi:hypothetical protein
MRRCRATPGGKRCFFGYTVSPGGEIWWFGNPPTKRELSPDELRQTTSEGWKERLAELYSGDTGPAVEIVRATTNKLACTKQYEMPSVATWHRDKMIIVGDAAHAASPTSRSGRLDGDRGRDRAPSFRAEARWNSHLYDERPQWQGTPTTGGHERSPSPPPYSEW